MPQKMFWRLTLLAVLISAARPAVADDLLAQANSTRRSSPAARATHSVHWDGISLGDAVARIRVARNAGVLLDRRIDPNLRVTLTVSNATVDEIIEQLASACGIGACRVGDTFYLGPREVAERLPTLATMRRRDVGRIAEPLRNVFRQRKSINWPRLTEPRDLILQLATQHGLRVVGGEAIPFDVWAAGHLPRMPLTDQLSLLLVGFDLSYRLAPDSAAVTIEPIDWARIEPHRDAVKPQTPAAPPIETRQVYTLRVQEQPVGAILSQLGQRLGWQLDVDEAAIRAAGRSLDVRVSFSVEDADVDALLEAVLEPAGLQAKREGKRVQVIPR